MKGTQGGSSGLDTSTSVSPVHQVILTRSVSASCLSMCFRSHGSAPFNVCNKLRHLAWPSPFFTAQAVRLGVGSGAISTHPLVCFPFYWGQVCGRLAREGKGQRLRALITPPFPGLSVGRGLAGFPDYRGGWRARERSVRLCRTFIIRLLWAYCPGVARDSPYSVATAKVSKASRPSGVRNPSMAGTPGPCTGRLLCPWPCSGLELPPLLLGRAAVA